MEECLRWAYLEEHRSWDRYWGAVDLQAAFTDFSFGHGTGVGEECRRG